jgi:hypothetical protein
MDACIVQYFLPNTTAKVERSNIMEKTLTALKSSTPRYKKVVSMRVRISVPCQSLLFLALSFLKSQFRLHFDYIKEHLSFFLSLSFSLLALLPPIAFCEPSRYQLRIEDAEKLSSFSFQFCQQYYQNFRYLHSSLLILNLKILHI